MWNEALTGVKGEKIRINIVKKHVKNELIMCWR